MATLKLTEEQVLALKVVVEYLNDDDNFLDSFAEGLEISNEDRGLTEDGEEKDGYDEGNDAAYRRFGELRLMILSL